MSPPPTETVGRDLIGARPLASIEVCPLAGRPPRLAGDADDRDRTGGRTRGEVGPDRCARDRACGTERTWPEQAAAGQRIDRELKLLVDHRENLVDQRRRTSELDQQLEQRAAEVAPALLELPGCAANHRREAARRDRPIDRFRSDAQLARHGCVAPLEASNSAPLSTGSRSRKPAATRPHASTSSASVARARAAAKQSAASNDCSSASSSTRSNEPRHTSNPGPDDVRGGKRTPDPGRFPSALGRGPLRVRTCTDSHTSRTFHEEVRTS